MHTASTTSLPLRSTFCARLFPAGIHSVNENKSGNAQFALVLHAADLATLTS
jgi:hypothetical protein